MKPNILFIGDDETTYTMLRVSCMYLDLEVIRAADSYEGVRLARALTPLAIYIDAANTLSYNGWVTARIIRADRALHAIPVIVLSDAPESTALAEQARVQHLPRQMPIKETRRYIQSLTLASTLPA